MGTGLDTTFLLALWAAVLTTLLALCGIVIFLRSRVRMRAVADIRIIRSSPEGKAYLCYSITNRGKQPFTVKSVGGQCGWVCEFHFSQADLPKELNRGESYFAKIDFEDIPESLTKLCMWDSAGKSRNVKPKHLVKIISKIRKSHKEEGTYTFAPSS
jgi:hypothetical protein